MLVSQARHHIKAANKSSEAGDKFYQWFVGRIMAALSAARESVISFATKWEGKF